MDFVVGLPWSNGHDAIWVVADRLTKQRHLVPCRGDVDAKDLADLFLQWVFRLHGLPETIVSDRGTQFASHFWGRLCERLRIGRRMSTAFHPQTDGQTERFNSVMEQYLRSYINYLQDDWSTWLPLAEFAANNQVSETTQVTPFFALHGYHPRATTSLEPPPGPTPGDTDALTSATALREIHDHLRAEIARAQSVQAEGGNQRRIPAPVFRPGDRVWLDARNIKTRRPSPKLDHRRLGPYEVIESVGPSAVHLRLPNTVRLHPVFHVSLVEHAASDPLPGQHSPPPPAVIVDGEEEWEVERILDSRHHYRHLQYLVKWIGYDAATWQPADDLGHAAEAVRDFHCLNPDRPRPLALNGARALEGGYCHGAVMDGHSEASDVDRTWDAASGAGVVAPGSSDRAGAGSIPAADRICPQGCQSHPPVGVVSRRRCEGNPAGLPSPPTGLW